MSCTYSIKPGDTINKIVDKNDLSIKQFKQKTDIYHLKLIANQVILIPLPHETSIKLYQYKTELNDTISNISEKFNVEIDKIKYFNNIYELILTEYQELSIELHDVSQGILLEFDHV